VVVLNAAITRPAAAGPTKRATSSTVLYVEYARWMPAAPRPSRDGTNVNSLVSEERTAAVPTTNAST
jgi:hypothetical protein